MYTKTTENRTICKPVTFKIPDLRTMLYFIIIIIVIIIIIIIIITRAMCLASI